MKIKELLQRRYCYGGKLCSLGSIIADLQKIAPNPQCVDRYLQGLFLTQGTGQ